ncbi:MAG TPA: hypothetical protein PLV68_20715 [Ilumatobacteraceae bacterium]|nr:hypothetical protein [Ilumatobacteraceae bacterium]
MVLSLGAAIVAVVVGVRVLASTDDSPADSAPPPVADAPDATMPTGPTAVDEFGVPQGWRRDPAGALSAAVSAVQLTGPIARAGFITRSDMIASLASDRYGPTLASESANQLAEMTAVLGEASVAPDDLVWSELPLTAQVVHADDRVAQVELWSVLVVGVRDVGAPRQAWRTVTVDLVWEADDWKVGGWSSQPGPTPLLDSMVAVASTSEIDEVVSWAPVGGG